MKKYLFSELIEEITELNTELLYGLDDIVGVTIEKGLIPTIANLTKTELNKFYIVKPDTFVFNPRTHGVRLGMGYNDTENTYITSWNNVAFKVKDEARTLLNPEYLWLYFNRTEWDRETNYHAWGSSTIVFSWNTFRNLSIKLPEKEVQDKIVRQYKVIKNRIKLKKQINDNLAATIKTIFKSWFLDFDAVANAEFVQSEYGQIPQNWRYKLLGDLCKCVTKGTTPTTLGKYFTDSGINFIKGESINDDHSFNKAMFAHIDEETDNLLKRSRILENDIVFTIAGTLGKFALVDSSIVPANTNQAVAIIRTSKISPEMLYSYFIGEWQVEFYKKNTQQAVQANLSLTTIKNLPILLPDKDAQKHYMNLVEPLIKAMRTNFAEVERLSELQNQLLTRLSSSR